MLFFSCTLDSDQAFDIALGNVDFETGKRVDSFNPDEFKVGFFLLLVSLVPYSR